MNSTELRELFEDDAMMVQLQSVPSCDLPYLGLQSHHQQCVEGQNSESRYLNMHLVKAA
jgi:hypothetical protein